MSKTTATDIFKNVTNVTDAQASALITAINSSKTDTLIGSSFSLNAASANQPNPEFDLATQIKPSAIRLAALQSEYNVVMTMYQNAYQDYKNSVAQSAAATIKSATDNLMGATTTATTTTTALPTHLKLTKTTYKDGNSATNTYTNIASSANCQTKCVYPACTGASYNSTTSTCNLYGGIGAVYDSGEMADESIIPVKEFPTIVLKMLSDKLDALQTAIKIQTTYLNILPTETSILTDNGSVLTSAAREKNRIDKIIADTNHTIQMKLDDSERFVRNKYSIYTLSIVIVMILFAIYAADVTFSIAILILIILIITINTTIFSGIILFMAIFFYGYLQNSGV